jgi:hypothetical protein
MQIVKFKTISSFVAAGVAILAILFGFRAWTSLKRPVPQLEPPKSTIPDIPGSFYLKSVSIAADAQAHLLDGNFKEVTRVNEIPSSCSLIFESSFVTISGAPAKPGDISLANPGERFQASDNVVPGLPFRRLEFAGVGATKCFIHYQSGGGPNSFCLALMDYSTKKMVFVGESQKAARSVNELRQMMVQEQFGEPGGWVRSGC